MHFDETINRYVLELDPSKTLRMSVNDETKMLMNELKIPGKYTVCLDVGNHSKGDALVAIFNRLHLYGCRVEIPFGSNDIIVEVV